MNSNEDVFSVIIFTEKTVKIFCPTSCLELKLFPIKINKLAISASINSYYFHIYLVFFLCNKQYTRKGSNVIGQTNPSIAQGTGLRPSCVGSPHLFVANQSIKIPIGMPVIIIPRNKTIPIFISYSGLYISSSASRAKPFSIK